MAILLTTCPHCRTPQAPLRSAGFDIPPVGPFSNGFFVCPICHGPTSIWMDRKSPSSHIKSAHDLANWLGTLEDAGWTVIRQWPTLEDASAPAATPPGIARNFVQAEEAAARKHHEAAGMAYRRVLELTTKDKAPELKGTLAKRIDALADAGRLTEDIKEWAHSVRELGNEAAHDEGVPSDEDIADLGAITRVVLEYLYTMPAKVARRAAPPESDEAS